MKRYLSTFLLFMFLIAGCSSSNQKEVEKVIQDAFKARADVVFLYKDKKVLQNYFSPKALGQSRDYLAWSPKSQWNNVKNLKYSTTIRINNLKVDGKQASAEVFETAVVTWDYIDPSKVMGTAFAKEDAWTNKKHIVTMFLTADGKWLVEEDVIQ